jgi:hypothetical protein
MPVRRRLFPKLTDRDKLRKSVFDLEVQLGQARTKAERDRLNQNSGLADAARRIRGQAR